MKNLVSYFWIIFFFFNSFLGSAQVNDVGPGNCLRFDGVDDYIDLGNIYDDVKLPVTISAWIFIETTSPITLPIFDSQDNSLTYNGFTMIVSNYPHIGLTYGDGTGGNNPEFRASKAGIFSYLPGRWVNVTGVMSGPGDMKVYLNGYDIGGNYEGNSSLPMNSNSPSEVAKIGSWYTNSLLYRFKGKMDELRIWNKALSETEIRNSMCRKLKGNEPGLIGYWSFDEAGGDKVYDKSLAQHHGAIVGNPERIVSGAPVGDESVYLYSSSWSGQSLTMANIKVSEIGNNPFGVHIYKVNSDPSNTDGLESVGSKSPYFGVFLAHDEMSNKFSVSMKEEGLTCSFYTRANNGAPAWARDNRSIFDVDQIELITTGEGKEINFNLAPNATSCIDTYRIDTGLSNDVDNIEWNTGETTPYIVVTEPGSYSVQASNGCLISMSIVTVSFGKAPSSFTLGEDQVICRDAEVNLHPEPSFDTEYEYTWQDGSASTSFAVKKAGTYSLKVSNECGEVTDDVTIRYEQFNGEEVPNVITPNSDLLNDVLEFPVEGVGLPVEILNRWGQSVFFSPAYQNNWGPKDLSSGVYFWRCVHPCLGEIKGTVSVLH